MGLRSKSSASLDGDAAPVARDDWSRESDLPAILGQFLNQVTLEDVIVESVQNELDQGARHTRLEFSEDRFVCHGDGDPVDASGWRRLAVVVGSGGRVPSKSDGIGAKNHGLRTLFSLGDTIHIRSDGLRTRQTVSTDGRYLDPACLRKAEDDDEPVTVGCRIEVPYRTGAIQPQYPGGDVPTLKAPTLEQIRALVAGFTRDGPWRLLGCVAPWNARCKEYTLEIRTWEQQAPHSFRCRILRGGDKREFERVCEYTSPDGRVDVRRERAVAYALRPETRHRVPWVYRAPGGRVWCEVSWRTDQKGRRVAPEQGGLRYPLGYPQRSADSALTFSAPFVSDTVRHGLAAGRDGENDALRQAIRAKIPQVLRTVALRRFGPKGMNVLTANPDPLRSHVDKDLVTMCLDEGVLPTDGRGQPPVFIPVRTGASQGRSVARHCPATAALIPSGLLQLSPAAPDWLRIRLSDKHQPGLWTIVDEEALLDLLRPPERAGGCAWPSAAAWRAFMASPKRVRAVLDVVGRVPIQRRRSWREADLHLPDTDGTPRPIKILSGSTERPPEVPGVDPPLLLHTRLAGHRTLKAAPLKVDEFDASKHAASLDASSMSPGTKGAVFKWLHQRLDTLNGAAISALKSQPIWRTHRGEFVTFDVLVEPRRETEKRILQAVLHRPAADLLKIKRVAERRSGLAIRDGATLAHIKAWYASSIADGLDDAELSALERDMARLADLKGLRQSIRALGKQHVTMTAAGTRRPVGTLYDTQVGRQLGLLPEDCVAGDRSPTLMRLLGVQPRATPEAVIRALLEDPDASLFADRLHALGRINSAVQRQRLSRESIVPHDGGFHAPESILLVKPNVRDAYGRWRVRIPLDAFPVVTRNELVHLGAIGQQREARNTIAFFQWLAAQSAAEISQHRREVIRHWKESRKSPADWAQKHRGIPCLPVESAGGYALLPFQRWDTARLNDYRDLARALAEKGSTLPLVVDQGWNPFHHLIGKVRSLRDTAIRKGPPEVVEPGDDLPDFASLLAQLQHPRTRERLDKCLIEIAGGDVRLPTGKRGARWLARTRFDAVRAAGQIRQTFTVARHRVTLEVPFAPDESTLWVAADGQSAGRGFFQALATLIFPGTVRPLHGLALEYAFARVADVQLEFAWSAAREAPDLETSGGVGRTAPVGPVGRRRHQRSKGFDPRANLPRPFPVGDVTPGERAETSARQVRPSGRPSATPTGAANGAGGSRGAHRPRTIQRRQGADRPYDEVEATHVDALKRAYAFHCQICLGQREPNALAPPQTYAAEVEHRARFLEAHHVDHYADEGARDAGNLIVLCLVDHHDWGDHLEHSALTVGLRLASSASRRFSQGDTERIATGCLVKVDTPRGPCQLFFEPGHRETWLKLAQAE